MIGDLAENRKNLDIPEEGRKIFDQIISNAKSFEPRAYASITREALRDFVKHGSVRSTLNKDLQVLIIEKPAKDQNEESKDKTEIFIDDEKENNRTIRLTYSESEKRLLCHHCPLTIMQCEHIDWAAETPEVVKLIKSKGNKPPRPHRKPEKIPESKIPTFKLAIDSELFDEADQIRKQNRILPQLSIAEFILRIVATYWYKR